MSEDSTPTLSVIAPLHAQLLHDTEAAGVGADTPVIREIKLAIHEDLAKRYSSAQDKRMLHSASFLDPRFKALPFLTKEDQLEVHANVVAEAATLESHVNSEEAEDKSETPQPDPEEGPAPKRRPSALVTLLGKTFTEENASGEVYFPEPDFETHPQSTPIKSQHRADEELSGSSGPCLSSALTLVLTSPPQTTTTGTRQSLSRKYIALAPTWSHSGSEEDGETDPEVCDVSMSFGDLSLDPADTSFVPPSSDLPSSTGTMSGSASSSGDTATGWAEKKWLVNNSHLLQLSKPVPSVPVQ
ncbi:hypothetical protein ABVT39_004807 [Epinephelus coioides]